MNLKSIFITAAAFSLIASSMVFAGHHYHGGHGCTMPSWDMNEMDTDNNGNLSFDEYMDIRRQQMRAGFDMIDTDGDGVVSKEEWAEFLKVHDMKKS